MDVFENDRNACFVSFLNHNILLIASFKWFIVNELPVCIRKVTHTYVVISGMIVSSLLIGGTAIAINPRVYVVTFLAVKFPIKIQ